MIIVHQSARHVRTRLDRRDLVYQSSGDTRTIRRVNTKRGEGRGRLISKSNRRIVRVQGRHAYRGDRDEVPRHPSIALPRTYQPMSQQSSQSREKRKKV